MSSSRLCITCNKRPKASRQSRCRQCLSEYKKAKLSVSSPPAKSKTRKAADLLPKRSSVVEDTIPIVDGFVIEGDYIRTVTGKERYELPKDYLSHRLPKMVPKGASIPITPTEPDLSNLIRDIQRKHNVHMSLSISRDGKTRLQIHTSPDILTYKANSPLEALMIAAL